MVELDQQLTTSQLIPQAAREQERTRLLEKVVEDFKNVCDSMDVIRKDTLQHVEDVCRMKLEVSQMRGKAALESHEAVTGDKDPYTQWTHCEHIVSTDNMWPQCAQWAHFDRIQNLPTNVATI